MKPTVLKALEEWKEAWDATQERAVNALCLALPGLGASKTPAYCCPHTLVIDKPNILGEGKVCIDDDGLATIELTDVPNAVIAEAVDALFGIGWFDGADGPLDEAGPGTYYYDSEQPRAEYVVKLGENDVGSIGVDCLPIGWAGELLEALTAARERQEQEAAATG
ncbi:hypothetical protein EF903_17935 [Streptomyces sp. WAC05292]|uniref:hypothetical protein n=1 Tax=Streptomyces sp. WAC05292 TaxID=2487418 RepID=UPI000F737180|nr:hypothetical protein [Streptomyces sp. WAC05292]RSS86993.1 hypothetical protein EF903_17935 [Streptomyces sp. WAC05292]